MRFSSALKYIEDSKKKSLLPGHSRPSAVQQKAKKKKIPKKKKKKKKKKTHRQIFFFPRAVFGPRNQVAPKMHVQVIQKNVCNPIHVSAQYAHVNTTIPAVYSWQGERRRLAMMKLRSLKGCSKSSTT
jgi:hypothetical protein